MIRKMMQNLCSASSFLLYKSEFVGQVRSVELGVRSVGSPDGLVPLRSI